MFFYRLACGDNQNNLLLCFLRLASSNKRQSRAKHRGVWGRGATLRILLGHVAGPAMTEIPMVVVDKLEVWKGELLLQQGRELVLNGLGPLAN